METPRVSMMMGDALPARATVPSGRWPEPRAEWFGVAAALLAVMAAALAAVAPFFIRGTASGHDIAFHLTSWMDVAAQWREGILFPRWAAWANYGYGEPRFIFYPPVSWLLGAALGAVLPWKAVPGAVSWLALVLAGGAMFRLARTWLPLPDAAVAAVLYAVNPYHLVVVYFRSDYAELLASALLPLVVHYAVVSAPARAAAELRPRVAPLAIVFALVWLCNVPAGVIVSYSLTLLLATLALLRRSLRTLLSGAAAIALGFVLSAFYLLPALWEQRWIKIAAVLSAGLRPEQNFLFTAINDSEHNEFNLLVSTIGLALVTLTGVVAIISGRRNRQARQLWWALLVLGAAATSLMLSPSRLPWRYLPILRFVQFPWRWLFPLGLVFAFFTAAALRQTRARWLWTLLMGVTLMSEGRYLVQRTWWDTQDAPELQAAITHGQGYEGTDEYQSLDADHYDLPRGAPLVSIAPDLDASRFHSGPAGAASRLAAPALALSLERRVRVQHWAPEEKLFTVDAPSLRSDRGEPVVAALRLMNYPAWRVEVNGHRAEAESQEDTGQMLVPLPAGRSTVRVRFVRTPDRTLGAALTALGVLFLLGMAGTRYLSPGIGTAQRAPPPIRQEDC